MIRPSPHFEMCVLTAGTLLACLILCLGQQWDRKYPALNVRRQKKNSAQLRFCSVQNSGQISSAVSEPQGLPVLVLSPPPLYPSREQVGRGPEVQDWEALMDAKLTIPNAKLVKQSMKL